MNKTPVRLLLLVIPIRPQTPIPEQEPSVPTTTSHFNPSSRYLFLNKNPLVTVPDMTFGSKVLQLVDFSNCRLTHVPKTMPLSVSDFRLNDNSIMQINDTDFTVGRFLLLV